MLRKKEEKFDSCLSSLEKKAIGKRIKKELKDIFNNGNGMHIKWSSEYVLLGEPLITSCTIYLNGVMYKMAFPSLVNYKKDATISHYKEFEKNMTSEDLSIDDGLRYAIFKTVLVDNPFYSYTLTELRCKCKDISYEKLIRQFKMKVAQDYRNTCCLQLKKQYNLSK